MRSADAKDKAALKRLESRLSMEEIAHFRAFVAARSSKVLTKSELHQRHAVDAVDAVVANLGARWLSPDAVVPVVPALPPTTPPCRKGGGGHGIDNQAHVVLHLSLGVYLL